MAVGDAPPSAIIWTRAGIGADVMLSSLQATLVLGPTYTAGVTKSRARLAVASESTAARAKIERTMGNLL
jgi:hypothetical protein